jgi:hypothetical protein
MKQKVFFWGLLVCIAAPSLHAIQPDAPFLTFQKRKAAEWAKQDKQIDARLAALEKKFGKKPRVGRTWLARRRQAPRHTYPHFGQNGKRRYAFLERIRRAVMYTISNCYKYRKTSGSHWFVECIVARPDRRAFT